MNEYHIDFSSMTNDMADLLIQEGGVVGRPSRWSQMPVTDSSRYVVVFGHRKIHYYAGQTACRVFFNPRNVQVAVMMLLSFGDKVINHNIKELPMMARCA